MDYTETIKNLREALRFSPDNLPLRKHLADTLFHANRYAEAEFEYKEALQLAQDDQALQLGLGKTFFKLEKYDAALVLTEEMLSLGSQNPEVYLLHARLLYLNEEYKEAYEKYLMAISGNRHLADSQFEAQLNTAIGASGQAAKLPKAGEADAESQTERETEKPRIGFQDVGGMDALKEEISLKVIYPLKNPAIYKAYGKKIGGGILLYGPPGCGKTHLARATAGEINASFIAVGINDVLDMWIGNSEKNLHGVFQQARQNAPCVLFFDEVDALGASRTDMRRSEGRFLINQFLNELDGSEYSNEGILILAATNSPWYLDAAFRRPGRFDRLIFVPPPDKAARISILELMLQRIPTEKLDYETLAKLTEDFSGADLKAVVDMAVETRITESLKKGVPQPVTQSDLKNACSRHKATTREWFATAKNYALYANEGGLYDDILKYLKIKK
jgi:transitional endoplasmic reticulum ATPase